MGVYVGLDIGGTKCAAVIGALEGEDQSGDQHQLEQDAGDGVEDGLGPEDGQAEGGGGGQGDEGPHRPPDHPAADARQKQKADIGPKAAHLIADRAGQQAAHQGHEELEKAESKGHGKAAGA